MKNFWKHVVITGTCWYWSASKCRGGYGRCWHDGKVRSAHRVSYELHLGRIPDGMQIDHLCRNRACVNPAHLEPVTHKENILRGESLAAQHAVATHCKWGHEFSGYNVIRYKKRRYCRACNTNRAKAARIRIAASI